MARILYVYNSKGGVMGGHKMSYRHVEALRGLGFDAAVFQGAGSVLPAWLDYDVPIVTEPSFHPDDVLVVPDDAASAMRYCAALPNRMVVFSQNPYGFAGYGFEALDSYPAARFPWIMAVSPGLAALIGRAYPQARVGVVPCFADERLFRPAASKRFAVAFAPRKRPLEGKAIRGLFRKLHPRLAALEWIELIDKSEAEVARVMSEAALFLSLNRLESVGITTLEAMASRALCAGFLGVGGAQYATEANGLWVADEDCEAAADALARAADLALAGGPALEAFLDSGQRTAEQWSHVRFVTELERFWMQAAPDLRTGTAPV